MEFSRAEGNDVHLVQRSLVSMEEKYRAEVLKQLTSSPAASPRTTNHESEQASKSRKATESLLRSQRTLGQEIARINSVSAMLNEDAELIRDTTKEVAEFGAGLRVASGMIKTLWRGEMTDRNLILFGFGFLLLVAAVIAYRRLRFVLTPLVWLWGVLSPYFESLAEPALTSAEL
jgi:hypothetical protein